MVEVLSEFDDANALLGVSKTGAFMVFHGVPYYAPTVEQAVVAAADGHQELTK
jgi:hypothetical protein